MAERGRSASFQQLEKDVTCPECRKNFQNPKLLPCLHSVCAKCLHMRDGERAREGLRFLVSCPVCKEETELPKTGISSLPDAYYKHNMVTMYNMLEVIEGKKKQECKECRTAQPKEVSTFCTSCGFICSSCADNHTTMRTFSDHSIMPLRETDKIEELLSMLLSLKPQSKEGPLKCEKHGLPFDMYCKTCKRLVCTECTQSHHKQPNHHTSAIRNLIGEQKEDMRQYLESVQELRSIVNASIEGNKNIEKKLQQQKQTIKDTLDTSFAELIKQLKVLQSEVVENAEKTAEVQLEQLSKDIKSAEGKISKLDEIIQATEESLKHTTDQELLALKRYMTTRLKELVAQKKTTSSEPSKVEPLEFPISCAKKLLDVCEGHIEAHHDLSYSKTKAVGDGMRRATVNKETSFTIQMFTESGAPCLEKQEVNVKIDMPRTNNVIPSTVSPGIELGTYQVSYTPNAKGQYRISVTISGKEISGSPYSVSAKPSKLEWDKPCEVCISQEWPWGVACGPNRKIYVTAHYQHRVVVLDKEGRVLSTVGLKGQKPGYLWSPTGIAVDSEGYMYVADGQENGRIQKFNSSGQYVTIYSNLSNPQGVMLNRKEDRLYICDKDNRSVVVLNKSLQEQNVFGELSDLSLSSNSHGFENVSGHLEAPHSTAEDCDGNIYVTDIQDGVGCVHVFTDEGRHLKTIHHPTNPCFTPAGICIEDDLIYVCDSSENCLVIFRTNGELITTCGSYGTYAGQFHSPLSVAVDLDGFLYICDHCNARVQVY